VVLLDVRMPGRSGIEVLRELQREDPPATIFLTTFDATTKRWRRASVPAPAASCSRTSRSKA
jgi:DNA-binding NarL/FixJ family response regulator